MPLNRRTFVAASVGAACVPAVHAQAPYPTRSLRFVIAGGAGGSTDGIVRLLSARVETMLGQPIVVLNRPGGGGTIGTEFAARSPADGYTLLFGATYNLATNVTLVENLPYQPLRDFSMVTRLFDGNWMLAVNPRTGIRSVPELIESARRNPGKLNYSSFGNGNGSHLAMEVLKAQTGIHIVHIPYLTPTAAVMDLVGGRTDIGFLTLESSVLLDNGSLRAIGFTGKQRSPVIPDVPTMAESVPGYFYTSWGGLVVPSGTPRAIIETLNQAYVTALGDESIRDKIRGYGAEAVPSTPEAFRSLVEAEIPRLGELIKRSGAKVD